jgi:hypothetical protein
MSSTPFIIPENPQGLSHRLVDAGGTNFNHMFNLLEVDTGNFARLQSHDDLSRFAFYSSEKEPRFGARSRKSWIDIKEKAGN